MAGALYKITRGSERQNPPLKEEKEKCFITREIESLCTNIIYCILRGRIKEFNSSITTILFEVGSYRTVVG